MYPRNVLDDCELRRYTLNETDSKEMVAHADAALK